MLTGRSTFRSMRQYTGYTDDNADVHVFRDVDGRETPLPLRLDLRNHSPDGFNFGYAGSGPAQLALAILADHEGDTKALEHYQAFKFKVIARLPQGKPFTITSEQIDIALPEIARERSRDLGESDNVGHVAERSQIAFLARNQVFCHYTITW